MLSTVQNLCSIYGLKPQHDKGQNFLIDKATYEAIVEAADLKPDDIVLEVGPGLGFLTAMLAKRCRKVIAVELDGKLAAFLKTGLESQGADNIEIINQDILSFAEDLERGGRPELQKYKIVANLPYNISSIFLRRFLSGSRRPESLTLLLQKEVVERLTAEPPEMSMLALSVQYYGQPYMLQTVPHEYFWPAPKVESAIVKIEVYPEKDLPLPKPEEALFFRLLKFGFTAKRKMLKNNLAGGLHLSQDGVAALLEYIGLNPRIRAQELSLKEWQILFAKVRQFMV